MNGVKAKSQSRIGGDWTNAYVEQGTQALLSSRDGDSPAPHTLCKIWEPCWASDASQFEVMQESAVDRNEDDAHEHAMSLFFE